RKNSVLCLHFTGLVWRTGIASSGTKLTLLGLWEKVCIGLTTETAFFSSTHSMGLKNASGTKLQLNGAAYGAGIYMSPQSATSFGYSQFYGGGGGRKGYNSVCCYCANDTLHLLI